MFWVGVLTAGMTAFYVFRAMFLAFYGKYRGDAHPHESPPSMIAPLVLLAALSLGGGYFADVPAFLGRLFPTVEEAHDFSLVAISVSHIEEQSVVQLELPLGLADEARRPGARGGMARLVADRAIDTIRDRFGWESVGYASVTLDARRSVPDAFRELAERQL